MSRLVIPLYFRPPPKGRGRARKTQHGITLKGGEGDTLLSANNFNSLIDEIGERGQPRFHLFETRMEARAAQALLSYEEIRLRGDSSETEVGTLRDGEGVLAIFHKDRPVSDSRFELIDNRLVREREIVGSWGLSAAECAEALSAPAGLGRHDLATAVAAKVSIAPAELLRDIQIALERVPGAYTGFVSVSPEDIRGDYRLEGADPALLTDKLIQPLLGRASVKAELGDALNEAVDATVERLLAAHPEIVGGEAGSVGPEAGSQKTPEP